MNTADVVFAILCFLAYSLSMWILPNFFIIVDAKLTGQPNMKIMTVLKYAFLCFAPIVIYFVSANIHEYAHAVAINWAGGTVTEIIFTSPFSAVTKSEWTFMPIESYRRLIGFVGGFAQGLFLLNFIKLDRNYLLPSIGCFIYGFAEMLYIQEWGEYILMLNLMGIFSALVFMSLFAVSAISIGNYWEKQMNYKYSVQVGELLKELNE